MADEFKAIIKAELDSTQFQKDMNALLNNNYKVVVNNAQFSAQALNNLQQQLNNLTANINIQINQNSIKNAGKQVATDVSAKIKSEINATNPFNKIKNELEHNFNIPTDAIDKFIHSVGESELKVTSLSSSIRDAGKAGKQLLLTINGIDKTTNAQIQQVRKWDNQSKSFVISSEKVIRSFASEGTANLTGYSNNVASLLRMFKELSQIRFALNGLDKNSAEAKVLTDRFLEVHNQVNQLTQSITGLASGSYQLNAVDQAIENIGISSTNVAGNFTVLKDRLLDAFKGIMPDEAFSRLEAALTKSTSSVAQTVAKVDDLAASYKASASGSGELSNKVKELDAFVVKFAGATSSLHTQLVALRQQMNQLATVQDPAKVIEGYSKLEKTFANIEAQVKASSAFPKYTQDVNALVAAFKELGTNKLKLDSLVGMKGTANEVQAVTGRIAELEQRIITLVQKMSGLDPANAQLLAAQFSILANSGKDAEIEFANLQALLQNMLGSIPDIEFQKLAVALTANTSAFANAKAQVQDMANACQQSVAVNGELSNRYSALETRLQNLGNRATTLTPILKQIENEMNALATETNPDAVVAKFKNIEQALQQLEAKTKEVENALKLDNTKTAFTQQLDTALSNLTQTTQGFKQQIEAIKNEIANANGTKLNDLQAQWQLLSNQMKQAEQQAKLTEQQMQTVTQSKTLSNNIEAWMNKNTEAAKKFQPELQKILNALKNNADVKVLKNARNEFRLVQSEAKKLGLTVNQLGNSFKNFVLQALGISSTIMVFQKCVQLIRNMYEEVVKVDTAMTELYRVTNLSTAQYEGLYERMTNSAKAYGVALSDIINSTASWVRLGFDANTSTQLSEITAMYQHVTDLDEGTAVKNLVTAYKGYQDALLQVNYGSSTDAILAIVDRYDKLGKELPTKNYIG